ncbi:MAG: hypothetical protein KA421_05145 [Rhodoluna sp.]|nr:hypothetical protein [Rhodoluna sp.]
MNRRLTLAIGAVQALITVVIGLGALAVSLSVLWLFENDAQTHYVVAFRTASDIWLLAQGVSLNVAAGNFLGIKVSAFAISLIPLGYSIFLAWLAWRVGRRISGAPEMWPAWLGSIATYATLTFFVVRGADFKTISPNQTMGMMFPVLFFAIIMIAGSVLGEPRPVYGVARGVQSAERAAIRSFFEKAFAALPWVLRVVWSPALRAGTAVAVGLLAISAAGIALLLAFNWIGIITFYESVHATVLGGFAITSAQISLLPNFVVYAASWLTGVGFSIGEGSLISPLGSAAGPLPAIPVLAILPQGTLGFGMIAIVVPLVLAFFATLAIKKHAEDVRFEFATPIASALALGLSIAFVAASEMALLGWLASGAFGPGRFQTNGINGLVLFAVVFVEVAAVSVLASFFSARPDRPDHPLLASKRD